jgi:hypothetical protein
MNRLREPERFDRSESENDTDKARRNRSYVADQTTTAVSPKRLEQELP